jgi:hypothetical protein
MKTGTIRLLLSRRSFTAGVAITPSLGSFAMRNLAIQEATPAT